MEEYYLAYGSNLNLAKMKYRCQNAQKIGSTILDNYQLVYKGKANSLAYLTLEKNIGSFVPLGIFKVSKKDIYSLDIYEGYPRLYKKFYIPIEINHEKKEGLIYIMNENFDYYLPSTEYINTCLEGYKDFDFDKTFLEDAWNNTYNNILKRDLIKKNK